MRLGECGNADLARCLKRRGLGCSFKVMWKALLSGALLLWWLATTLGGVWAQSVADGARDPAAVAAFFDALIPAQLAAYEVPGATVSLVVDGEVAFARGYGFADLRAQKLVVAETTLFHAGSITKIFTWMATLQLVDAGVLDLHTDINEYLPGLQFPATYPEPITLHAMLTHTPGLEDRLSNLLHFSQRGGAALEDYVVRQQPTRIAPPGEYVGYSNYGGALVGYIVQSASGVPYEDYIEKVFFEPLGMTHSSVRRSPPAHLRDDVAQGHLNGPFGVMPLDEQFPAMPMVGLRTTATDAATLMLMLLARGCYMDDMGARQCLLSPDAAALMYEQQFTHDVSLPGITYGFVEWERNGVRMLWHSGSTSTFQGVLMLIPEDNVGLFVSYNRKTGYTELGKFLRADFLNEFYPVEVTVPEPMPDYAARAERYAGDYRESRWAHTTADRFIYMLTRYYPVTANVDGTLTFMDAIYVEVEPLRFHEVAGEGTLLFREDASGRITRAFFDYDAHKVFFKVRWYEALWFHVTIVAACFLTFFSTLWARWPVGDTRYTPEQREVLRLGRWISVINLLYAPVMLGVGLSAVMWFVPNLSFLAPFVLCSLAVALCGGVIMIFVAWVHQFWSPWLRWHYTLMMVAACVFAGWLYYWNLLGFWKF